MFHRVKSKGELRVRCRFANCLAVLAISILLRTWHGECEAEDWPHWRGKSRDGVTSEESGFDGGRWLSERPLWSGKFGAGGSSPIVVGETVYILGWADGKDTLHAVSASTGEPKWTSAYPAPQHARHSTGDEGLYAGPSSTPEFDPATGILYTLSLDGELRAIDTSDRGKLLWRQNLYDDHGAEQRPRIGRSGRRDYGYTTAPLVHSGAVIVEAGGKAGTLVAYDKRSGKQLWASQCKHLAGHTGGLAPITIDRQPCVAVLTLTHLVVVDASDDREGQTVAEYPWTTEFANNIATPAVSGDKVLITSGYNHESICCLKISPGNAEKIWEQPYHSKICSPVIHDGHVYFAYQKLRCLDLATGRQLWEGGEYGEAGSCIATADSRIIVWANRGTLAIVAGAKESPRDYRELARFPGSMFEADVWPHIVLSDGRLFCKDREGHVKCFEVAGRKK